MVSNTDNTSTDHNSSGRNENGSGCYVDAVCEAFKIRLRVALQFCHCEYVFYKLEFYVVMCCLFFLLTSHTLVHLIRLFVTLCHRSGYTH